MKMGLATEADKGSYSDLFKGVNRRRTLIVIGSNFFLQATGQAFSSQYGAIFVRSLGTINPFNLTLIQSFLGCLTCLTAMIMVDKLGRRPMMIGGSAMQALTLCVMGGVGLITPQTDASKIGVVSMLVIGNMSFIIGWAPLNYIITSEMPEQRLRDKTQRVGSWVNIATNCVVAFTLPYMLFDPGNLGGRVGFIYGAFALIACLFAFLCIPECKGRSFEEVSLLFQHHVSATKSARWVAPSTIEGLSEVADAKSENAEDKQEDEVRIEKV